MMLRLRVPKLNPGRSSKMSDVQDEQRERSYSPLSQQLLEGMNQLRSNHDLCDITVIVGNKPFQAHKAVLASLSEYFQVMFTNSGFVDMKKSEIEIKEEGLSAQSFDQLLDFMYTGKAHMTSIEGAIDLLHVAGFLQVKGAIKLCVDYLKEVIRNQEFSFEMAFDLSATARTLDHPDLKNLIDRYVGQSMVQFVNTTEFLEQMPTVYLEELLKREDLNETMSEEQLLEVVVAWLQFDWDKRKADVCTLLQHIHFGVIPKHSISDILGVEIEAMAEPYISTDEGNRDAIYSTHRGSTTVTIGDIKATYQVVRKDQQQQGFREATKKDLRIQNNDIQALLSHVLVDWNSIYPCNPLIRKNQRGCIRYPFPPRFDTVPDPDDDDEYLDYEDDDQDDQEIKCGDDVSHKLLTNLPEFQVAEISDDEVNGWCMARYSEVESCLHMIKPLLRGARVWYICALDGGKIGGSGYEYGMSTGEYNDLGHKLMVRYPPEFSVVPTKRSIPGWKLATFGEVESNIKLVKSLLMGKKSGYVCLLQGGSLSGEEHGVKLKVTEADAPIMADSQIVIKKN